MKQVFLILFLSLSSLQLSAQELKVESFNILDKDLDASVYYPKEDMTTGNNAEDKFDFASFLFILDAIKLFTLFIE